MNTKTIKFFTCLIFLSLITTSCSLYKGYVIYDKKENSIKTENTLKEYFSKQSNPNIVIKLPLNYSMFDDYYNQLYNTIEETLSDGGFLVKNRKLFNQAIRSEPGYSYKELLESKKYEITETDLIFEIINIKTNIEYNTELVYNKENELINYTKSNIKRIGASIKFNIINMSNNKIVGSYNYQYTPCASRSDDCRCLVAYRKSDIHPYYKYCPENVIIDYDKVNLEDMTDFLNNIITQFLNEIKI